MREHDFDHNGNVAVHRSDCWCVEWDEAVRAAEARNRQARATDEVDEGEEGDIPWWQR